MQIAPPVERGHHLPSLDGVRAICIALVVGAHLHVGAGFPASWVVAARYVFNGDLGVRIFFVLSGFLITYLLAREEQSRGAISLRDFYLRRCLRILPVYFTFIAVVACLDLLTGLDLEPLSYLTAATFTKDFVPGTWIMGHLWSISVEEQFYIFWPLLLALGHTKTRWYAAAAMLLLAPLFRVWFYLEEWKALRLFSFMANMDALMIGSIAALLVAQDARRALAFLSKRTTLLRGCCMLAIYSVWLLELHFKLAALTVPFGPTVQSLAAAYLLASYAFVREGLSFRLLNLRALQYIGVLSYSIYIWQQIFFMRPQAFGFEQALLLTFPFNVVAIFTVSAVSYHLLEKPLLSLRRRLRSARPTGDTPVQAAHFVQSVDAKRG